MQSVMQHYKGNVSCRDGVACVQGGRQPRRTTKTKTTKIQSSMQLHLADLTRVLSTRTSG